MSALGEGNLVGADVPVGVLLNLIVEPGFLYVVDGVSIGGFISVSDFNKQPVRGYLYLQLAFLETNLAALIGNAIGADEAVLLSGLNSEGRRQVQHRRNLDRQRRLDTELTSYLDFAQLLSVASNTPVVSSRLGEDLLPDVARLADRLNDLRRRVMHPIRGLVADKLQLIELRDTEDSIDRLARGVVDALNSDEADTRPARSRVGSTRVGNVDSWTTHQDALGETL